jgi:hypothetical protein
MMSKTDDLVLIRYLNCFQEVAQSVVNHAL